MTDNIIPFPTSRACAAKSPMLEIITQEGEDILPSDAETVISTVRTRLNGAQVFRVKITEYLSTTLSEVTRGDAVDRMRHGIAQNAIHTKTAYYMALLQIVTGEEV